MEHTFTPGPRAPQNGYLQTGAPRLDERLRDANLARGGAVHLDFEDDQLPALFLLGLCKTALDRGERVVFVSVPIRADMDECEYYNRDQRAGRRLEMDFERGLDAFGLAPFFNAARPADPDAKLRYLVANTFEQFENTLEALLLDPAGAPDQVAVYGLDQLLPPTEFFHRMSQENQNILLQQVRGANARLTGWLSETAPRLQDTGTTVFLACSPGSCELYPATQLKRGMRPLLYAHCKATLCVSATLTSGGGGERPWSLEGVRGVPVTLYRGDEIWGEAFVEVLADEDGFDGLFLDGEGGADFLDALN